MQNHVNSFKKEKQISMWKPAMSINTISLFDIKPKKKKKTMESFVFPLIDMQPLVMFADQIE